MHACLLACLQALGPARILARELALADRVLPVLAAHPCIKLLGPLQCVDPAAPPRLPVLSFLVAHPASGLYLHHNFVCALLNDLFGVQARGGCACAGPYAQDLLGIDTALADAYEAVLLEDSRLDRTHLRRQVGEALLGGAATVPDSRVGTRGAGRILGPRTAAPGVCAPQPAVLS